MKKYLLGSIAIIMAIGLFSFTHVGTRFAGTATFHYNSTDYSQGAVSSPKNWAGSSITCDGINDLACTIQVDSVQVNPDGTLKSTTVINTQPGLADPSKYCVASGGDVSSFTNKQ